MSHKVSNFGKQFTKGFSKVAYYDNERGEWVVDCQGECGFVGNYLEIEAAHDIAYEQGGKSNADNLLLLCRKCNENQASLSGADFLGFESYAAILRARALPVRQELASQLDEAYCQVSRKWLRRHGSKEQRAKYNHLF